MEDSKKIKIITLITWLGIAAISTGVSFVFIVGFKEILGF